MRCLILALSILAAPASAQNAPRPTDGVWMVAPPGDETETSRGRGAPYLGFEHNGRVFGFGGCNRVGGRMDHPAEGDSRFEVAALTRMRCGEEAARSEAALLEALAVADGYRMEGTRLMLTTRGEAVLLLTPRPEWFAPNPIAEGEEDAQGRRMLRRAPPEDIRAPAPASPASPAILVPPVVLPGATEPRAAR